MLVRLCHGCESRAYSSEYFFQVAPVYFLYTFVSTAAANKVLSENWVSTEHLDCIG